MRKLLLALFGLLVVSGGVSAQTAVTVTVTPGTTTGTTVFKENFGIDSGVEDDTGALVFSNTNDANFRAAMQNLSPSLLRINFDGATGGCSGGTTVPTCNNVMDVIWPTRASAANAPAGGNWAPIQNFLNNASAMLNFNRTRLMIDFSFWPSWLNPATTSDCQLMGQMVVGMVQQFTNAGIPVHYFESFNEPDATAVTPDLQCIFHYEQIALKANDSSAKVGALSDSFEQGGRIATLLTTDTPDFIAWHNYAGTGVITNLMSTLISEAQSSIADVNTQLSNAGKSGIPLFMGEYGINGSPPGDPQEQNYVGATAALIYPTVGVQAATNVAMAGKWECCLDGNYGIITHSGTTYPIAPAGFALKFASSTMPGITVQTAQTSSPTLNVLATKNLSTGQVNVQLINYDGNNTSYTVNLQGLTGSSFIYQEVSQAHPGGFSQTISASALASITLTPEMEVWINTPTSPTNPGAILPPGAFHTSGSQIVDGVGDDVRLACTEDFVGNSGNTGSATEMAAIRAGGFNCVKIPYFDSTFASAGFTSMDAIVSNAATNNLRVIWEHRGNEPANGSACDAAQQNGLPYDLNSSTPVSGITFNTTNNTNGCGTTGTITYATYRANIISIATHYLNNQNVIGIVLHNAPKTPGAGNTTAVSWGATANGSNILAIYKDVGPAIQTANSGLLVFADGVINFGANFLDGTTMASVGGTGATGPMDLSLAATQPVTGVTNLVYESQVFPTNVGTATPDSGTNAVAFWNHSFGNLIINKTAPVFVGGGASLDSTNGNLTDDTNWSMALTNYINGQQPTGPMFPAPTQPISNNWYAWGNLGTQNPDGTLATDGVTRKSGQQSTYVLWEFGGVISGPATKTTWNPSDVDTGITLSNSNLTATSNGTLNAAVASTGVRSTTSKSSGKFCGDIVMSQTTNNWDIGFANGAWVLATPNGLGGDANGIGFDPNSPGNLQGIFFNNVVLSTGAVTSANGTVTICADFGADLAWFTTAEMRAAGNGWNNSPTASPAGGTGGMSFSGMACPCFVAFNEQDGGGVATLSLGTTAVTLPSTFSLWDSPVVAAASGHHTAMILQ